ncbi:MAG: UDP-N-acetylmuramoyl-tripeptide--D-alanyl-D-alanine ligase [Slackia sp.]|nr:UDP-N-acetylmuramoyl-tripeptide--D-alanyl-D-alanine ligase [Slackia sp.]
MKLDTNRILDITSGCLAIAPRDSSADLTGLTWDSRTAWQGCLYAALPGERVDGNDFVAAAIEAGAMLALASREPDASAAQVAQARGAGVIVVEDVEKAITELAAAWRSMLGATVIGITGSVGKTTVKSLTRQVLSSRFKTCATKGNFNNELGAPYTVLSADADCEMLVVEMGMDDLGQIEHICSFARPDMGLVNNVGVSHLERLGSRENIARAKAELFEALGAGAFAFLNADDDMTPFLREHARLEERGVVEAAFSMAGEPAGASKAVWAEDVSVDDEGRPRFALCARGFDVLAGETQRVECELGLRGVHNISNACGAAAIGLACGIDLSDVAQALSEAVPEAGRQEVKHAACGAVVFDDAYNASPASMTASLRMLASYKSSGRKIAVLGDMGELGEASVEGHRESGRAAAQAGLALLVCVGEAAGDIARGACEAGMPEECIVRVADADVAVAVLKERIDSSDVVLVKASHFMRLDRVVEGIIA